jgi:RimJ/RimL family protein N-acetyltransferase
VVTDEDDRSPRGLVSVTVAGAGVAEVGYWTAAHARRQGVAARALETVSRWALETQQIVRLTRLDLFHTAANQASCLVAAKCGYVLRDLLPPAPPDFPDSGHRHARA